KARDQVPHHSRMRKQELVRVIVRCHRAYRTCQSAGVIGVAGGYRTRLLSSRGIRGVFVEKWLARAALVSRPMDCAAGAINHPPERSSIRISPTASSWIAFRRVLISALSRASHMASIRSLSGRVPADLEQAA